MQSNQAICFNVLQNHLTVCSAPCSATPPPCHYPPPPNLSCRGQVGLQQQEVVERVTRPMGSQQQSRMKTLQVG
jgi:hypothetical protein